MRFRTLTLLVLCGCAEEEFDVLVTVQDPLGIAASATSLHVGASLDALEERDLGELEFVDQLSVTIGVNNTGSESQRWFWAEARDASDLLLARGATEIDFDGDDRATLELRAVCDTQALCPAPVETLVCCVGPDVCVERGETCPPDSTPTLIGFALAFEPGDRAGVSSFNVSPADVDNDDGISIEARILITEACTAPGGCNAWLINKPGQWNLRLEAEANRPYMLTARVSTEISPGSVESLDNLATDTPYHVAVTYDGTAIRLYVDGDPAAAPAAQTGRLETSSDTISSFGGDAHFVLDELRVWNRARTVQQLQGLQNETLTGAESDLVAHWSFDEGEGSIAHSSVNGHDMSLGEAPENPTWVRWQP